jgi:hypothetical protein
MAVLVSLQGTLPAILRLDLEEATPNSIGLPLGIVRFSMQPVDSTSVMFAFLPDQFPPAVGGAYGTMKDGAPYTEVDIETKVTDGSLIIYFLSATATTIEITCWR